jgi:hypothetical protein
MVMEIGKALKELNEYGFHIKQVEADKFMVYDTGLFGFANDEDPFIVDEDGVIEIYETYLKD